MYLFYNENPGRFFMSIAPIMFPKNTPDYSIYKLSAIKKYKLKLKNINTVQKVFLS